MSTQTRQPAGVPVGGQFAATTRSEGDLQLAAAGAGLVVPADLDDAHRQLVDALEVIGLNGTVTLSPYPSKDWARVEVTAPSGHEVAVGIATRRDRDDNQDGISAITVTVRAGDGIDDDEEVDVRTFGGRYGDAEIGEAVLQALVASGARAEFRTRFPDAETNGCTLGWIGQENAPQAWRRIGEPRPQVEGARFELDGGGEVLITSSTGGLEFELDGRTLKENDAYVRDLVVGDVSRRLGLTGGPFTVEDLGAAVVDVIATGKRRPVYKDNLRDQN